MNIRTYKKLEDGVYVVTVVTEQWSEADKALMTKYAEPSVNAGGMFADEYTDFTLPDSYVKVMTESPFTVRIDGRDYEDAEARALLWKDTMVDRITAAVGELRALADTFTGEEVVTV